MSKHRAYTVTKIGFKMSDMGYAGIHSRSVSVLSIHIDHSAHVLKTAGPHFLPMPKVCENPHLLRFVSSES